MRTSGSAVRLLAAISIASAAMAAHACTSRGNGHAVGNSFSSPRASRKLHNEQHDTERSSQINANVPLIAGRKCGVANVTNSEFESVQGQILSNWLRRNQVRLCASKQKTEFQPGPVRKRNLAADHPAQILVVHVFIADCVLNISGA